jgi:hypothetical protein
MRRFFIGSKSGEQDKSNKSDNIHLSKDLRNKINLFYLLTWNNEEVNIDDDSSVDIDTVTPKPDASTQTVSTNQNDEELKKALSEYTEDDWKYGL